MSARDFIAEAYRNPQDWSILHEDFYREGASNVPDTMSFDVIKDASAAVVCEADQAHGVLHMSSAATTNDDGSLVQSLNEFIKLTPGKRFAFEARVKLSDADDMDAFFGVAQRAATNPEATLTASNRVGFQVNDGDASLLLKSEASDLETSKDSERNLADDTYVKLGLSYDGARLLFHVDDSPVGSIESNIPTTEMAIALFELSGSNTGTKAARCDYVTVALER